MVAKRATNQTLRAGLRGVAMITDVMAVMGYTVRNAIRCAIWFVVLAGGHACAQDTMVIDHLVARHVGGQTFLTWDEAGLTPTTRLSVYRHAEPISQDNLADATLLCRDLMPGTSCDFSDLRRADYRRFAPLPKKNVRGAVVPWTGETSAAAAAVEIVEHPAACTPSSVRCVAQRIAPFNGLYVHTPRRAGNAYYAVVACSDDGVPLTPLVPGDSAVLQPVAETTTDFPEPILVFDSWKRDVDSRQDRSLEVVIGAIGTFQNDRKALADLERTGKPGRHYVLYGTREHGWREGLPFHFSVYGEGGRIELWPDDSNFAFMAFPNSWWFGVNDNVTRPDRLTEGVVRPTCQARLASLIDWIATRFNVDRNAITGGGNSMGGTGTLLFVLRHPQIFSQVHMGVPAVDVAKLPNARGLAEIIWGPLNEPVQCSEGGTIWDALNSTKYLQQHPVRMPFAVIDHGRHDTWMRWENNPAFYRVLRDQGQPCVVLWDDSGHRVAPRRAKFHNALASLPPVRRDRPFVAFAAGSRDGCYGDGGVEDGDPVGALSLLYRFDRLMETEDRVTVDYWFDRDGQTDGGRVDLLVYQLQRFPAEAGRTAVYSILEGATVVAEGAVEADARGAYRIRQAPCDKRHTLELRR